MVLCKREPPILRLYHVTRRLIYFSANDKTTLCKDSGIRYYIRSHSKFLQTKITFAKFQEIRSIQYYATQTTDLYMCVYTCALVNNSKQKH